MKNNNLIIGNKITLLYLFKKFILTLILVFFMNCLINTISNIRISVISNIILLTIAYNIIIYFTTKEYVRFNGSGFFYHKKLSLVQLIKFHISNQCRRRYKENYEYIPYKNISSYKTFKNKLFCYSIVISYKLQNKTGQKKVYTNKFNIDYLIKILDIYGIEKVV